MENFLDIAAISDVNISSIDVIWSIILSAVSSFIIKLMYIHFGRSLNNRVMFSNIFLLLGVVTCVVIIIVKYSLALSLGLVGALSIVRFRAAIKEPEELVYLFLIIAIGLSYGANQFIPGIMLTVFSSLVIYISYNWHSNQSSKDLSNGVVIVNGPSKDVQEWMKITENNYREAFELLSISSLTSKDGNSSLVLKIVPSNDAQEVKLFLDRIFNDEDLEVEFISDIIVPE